MSLRDTETMDLIVRSPEGGYSLVVLDLQPIADEQERHQLLVQKLATYAEYVATGQYRERIPDASPDTIDIRVLCASPPNASMQLITAIATREEPILRLPVVFEVKSDLAVQAPEIRAPTTRKKPWWKFWRTGRERGHGLPPL